ncbi:MAG: glycosyltransferase family 4 protein [Candidatus Bathyarchaeota archaeon]|nr:MAG: glycosyltransferase family 4 protein [Candidatus Bathyarchaeota archaeon]
MRVVMINDCAYIGETLLKSFPDWLKRIHVKRARSFGGKTFGLIWKTLRTKGDLYHVHYLLQDCYLASLLGKHPLVGHGHGSDLRETIQHPVWGHIVRYNLRNCDKILVSTPDLLGTAKKFAQHVEYLPNVVDHEFFFPREFNPQKKRLKLLIGSGADWRKGTDLALHALAMLKDVIEVSLIGFGPDLEKVLRLARSLDLEVKVLPKVLHQNMNNYYWNADLVLDQFKCGSLGVTALEAISCGRPVITYASSKYNEYRNFPLRDINSVEKIIRAIEDTDLAELWKREYSYLKENHELNAIATRTLRIYEEFLG